VAAGGKNVELSCNALCDVFVSFSVMLLIRAGSEESMNASSESRVF